MAFDVHFQSADLDRLVDGFSLPQPFFLGAATAGYQVEGGFNGPQQPMTNWARLEAERQVEISGPTCRFFELAAADRAAMQRIGLNMFRMSLEWARLQPDTEAREHPDTPPPFDEAALERYVVVIADLMEHGIEPCLTLHHFVHPLWAGLDLWLSLTHVEQLFGPYVEWTVRGLNRRLVARGLRPVRYWITLNELGLLAPSLYFEGRFPHGAPSSVANAVTAYRNLLHAHCIAYDTVHRVYDEEGWGEPMLSTNTFASVVYPLDKLGIDILCARERGVARADVQPWLAESARSWAVRMAEVAAPRPPFAPLWRAVEAIIQRASARAFSPASFAPVVDRVYASPYEKKLDFVSFDYYDPFPRSQFGIPPPGRRIVQGRPSFVADLSRQVLNPYGMRQFARAYAEGLPGKPLLIAENGMCHRLVDGVCEPRKDSATRDTFLRAYLYEVAQMVREGLPLLGYLHWSLFDNYEWGSCAPRFGLYYTDFAHDARRGPLDAFGINAAGAYATLVEGLRGGEAAGMRRAFLATRFPLIEVG